MYIFKRMSGPMVILVGYWCKEGTMDTHYLLFSPEMYRERERERERDRNISLQQDKEFKEGWRSI